MNTKKGDVVTQFFVHVKEFGPQKEMILNMMPWLLFKVLGLLLFFVKAFYPIQELI